MTNSCKPITTWALPDPSGNLCAMSPFGATSGLRANQHLKRSAHLATGDTLQV